MTLLLDTNVLYWWVRGEARLSTAFRNTIETDKAVLVSSVVVWEMSIKHASGKWDEAGPVLAALDQVMQATGFKELPITLFHARPAAALPSLHKDPFDRMLIAQALAEDAIVVTSDRVFADYGVPVLWA